MLDFNDITIDKIGRVMVAFADGCAPHSIEPDDATQATRRTTGVASNAVLANGLVQHGAIVRQQSGKGCSRSTTECCPAARTCLREGAHNHGHDQEGVG